MSNAVRIKVNDYFENKTLVGESVCLAFVGTAISKELYERSNACFAAGNKYQLGLIKGLEKAPYQLLQDPELRASMGDAGRRRAKQLFSAKVYRSKILAAFVLTELSEQNTKNGAEEATTT